MTNLVLFQKRVLSFLREFFWHLELLVINVRRTQWYLYYTKNINIEKSFKPSLRTAGSRRARTSPVSTRSLRSPNLSVLSSLCSAKFFLHRREPVPGYSNLALLLTSSTDHWSSSFRHASHMLGRRRSWLKNLVLPWKWAAYKGFFW